MSPASRPLPDAEALLAAFLRSRTAVAALLGDRVGSRLPREPVWPYAVVQRVGGAPTRSEDEDAPELQIDIWAETKESAYEVARAVVSEVASVRGDYPAFEGFVSGGAVTLGPLWQPDPLTSRPRYLVSVELRTHPREVE